MKILLIIFKRKNIVKEKGYKENDKEFKLKIEELSKNKFFFKDIFQIDEINDKLYLLSARKKLEFSDIFSNIDDTYKEYKNNYEQLIEESKEDLTEDINNILNDSKFYDKFKKILNQNQ